MYNTRIRYRLTQLYYDLVDVTISIRIILPRFYKCGMNTIDHKVFIIS